METTRVFIVVHVYIYTYFSISHLCHTTTSKQWNRLQRLKSASSSTTNIWELICGVRSLRTFWCMAHSPTIAKQKKDINNRVRSFLLKGHVFFRHFFVFHFQNLGGLFGVGQGPPSPSKVHQWPSVFMIPTVSWMKNLRKMSWHWGSDVRSPGMIFIFLCFTRSVLEPRPKPQNHRVDPHPPDAGHFYFKLGNFRLLNQLILPPGVLDPKGWDQFTRHLESCWVAGLTSKWWWFKKLSWIIPVSNSNA